MEVVTKGHLHPCPSSTFIYGTSTKGAGLISWNCFLHLAFLELFPNHCSCYCFSCLFLLFTACKQWIQHLFYYTSVNVIQYVFSDSWVPLLTVDWVLNINSLFPLFLILSAFYFHISSLQFGKKPLFSSF